MVVVLWTVVVLVGLLGLGLTGVSAVATRRRNGWVLVAGCAAVLLAMTGCDVLTVLWLMLAVGVVADRSGRPVSGPRFLIGVVAMVLFAALDLVIVRVDWRDVAPVTFRPQASEIGGSLLGADLALLAGAAVLLTVVLLASRSHGENVS